MNSYKTRCLLLQRGEKKGLVIKIHLCDFFFFFFFLQQKSACVFALSKNKEFISQSSSLVICETVT